MAEDFIFVLGVCAVEIGNLRFVKKSGNAGRKERPFTCTFTFTGGRGWQAGRVRRRDGSGLQTLTCEVTALRQGDPVNVNVHVNVNEGFSCYRADS